MIQHAGIILWGGEVGSNEILDKVNLLRVNGIPRVCVAATNTSFQTPRGSALITLYEQKPVGSCVALQRAIQYCRVSNLLGGDISEDGVLVVYGGASITPRMIQKMLQISTIAEARNIDMFAMTRVRQTPRPKLVVGHEGVVEGVIQEERGQELDGVMFIAKRFFDEMMLAPTRQIKDFIVWCVQNKRRIYAVMNSCCG